MADVRFIKVTALPNNGIPFATYFVDNGTHYAIHQANESGLLKPVYYDFLPDRTGNDGKVLTLVAGALSWEVGGSGSGLPDQTDNGGKVLMTDGTNAFWADVLVKRRGVIDGGEVSWTGSGLNFNVNYVDYYLESFVPFHTDPILVTSPPSDPALNRFDIVVVDDQEDVYIVAGTPAADPVKPQIDPLTQLELTTIYIPAGATEPGGVSNVVVYDEHVEYDTAATWASSVNFDNATGPLQGLKCIQAGNFANGNIMRFTVPGGGSINITEHSNFIFFVNLLANFSNSNGFQISFWSDAVTRVSSYLSVTNGNFGFSRTTLNAYQLINLPIASFTFTSSTVKIIEFRMLGASASNFRMDFIQLQKGITSVIEAPVPNLQQVTSQGNTTSLPIFAESFNLASNRGIFFVENLGGGGMILYNSTLAPTFGAIGSVDGSLKFYKDLGGLTGIVTSTLAWPDISANRSISIPNESGTLVLRVNGVAAGDDGNVLVDTLPDQTGNANKWLFTDGTNASWATLPNFILASEKGAALGVVPLNASTKIDTIYLPDSILGQVEYQGVWNATTNTPAIPAAAPANKGHYYIVNVAGSTSIDGINDWKVGDWIISDGTTWTKVDNTDAISSFNGRTGAILPIYADYAAFYIQDLDSVTTEGNFTLNSIRSGSGGFQVRNTTNTQTLGEWFNNGNNNSEIYIYNLANGRQIFLNDLRLEFKATNGNYQSIIGNSAPGSAYITFQLPNTSSDRYIPISVNGNFADSAGDITVAAGSSLPSQTGHAGEVLFTDGTNASWALATTTLLTGFVSGAGSVSSADTILQAIQKLDGNIAVNTTAIGTIQVGNNLFNYYNFK